MDNVFSRILLSLLFAGMLLLPTHALAKQELTIGVGNFPPFFIEKEQTGLFLEITEAIFEQLPEYQVKFIFMSNRRLLHEINYGDLIDVACNIFSGSQVEAHLSTPIFRYTDVAVSKKSSQLKIKQISDLQNVSIAAYQGATELLGNVFKKMANKNPNYSEHSSPKDTTHLLVTGRKDIRIGDIRIFWYDLKNKHYQTGQPVNVSQFSIHRLWPDVYSHMAFKDKLLRNKVNSAITDLTLNKSFDKIYLKYQL